MHPEPLLTSRVQDAVQALARGGLVGLPTETVYGLAADAEDARAVARIYAAKGRPADHPLIVHVPDAVALRPGAGSWARQVPAYAHLLAEHLWPGPLTLVLHRSARAGDQVTGGQDTVALRAPDHPAAQAVIRGFGEATGRPGAGVAAPSANRFGRVSPTTPRHVLDELADVLVPGLDWVLDGGDCAIGVESTIVDCTGEAPAVLRPGAIGGRLIRRIGGVPLREATPGSPRTPGTLAAHYAPRAEVVLTDQDRLPQLTSRRTAASARAPVDGLIAAAGVPTPSGVVRLCSPTDAEDYARALYAALREADALGLHRVLAVPPADLEPIAAGEAHQLGLVTAITDRLTRAATAPR